MTQAELLRHLVEVLETLGADYMHLRDIIGIIRVSGPELDERYIARWADELGVRTLWDRIRKHAE